MPLSSKDRALAENFLKLFERGVRKRGKQRVRGLTSDECDAFLHFQQAKSFGSSCVGWVQYFEDDKKLFVQFYAKGRQPEKVYLYLNITLQEAKSLCQATSAGIWIWDNLRVRGSKNLHRKPYWEIS